MGKHTHSAAVGLLRAVTEGTKKPLPRMQWRILAYLVTHGYVGGRKLARTELSCIATHYGRSVALVEHMMKPLVDLGALLVEADDWGILHYSYNADWTGEPEESP